MSKAITLGALTLAVLLPLACDGGAGSPTNPNPDDSSVASVTVSPASVALTVGDTTTVSASARTATGAAVTGRPVTWASSDTSIATVTGAGLVTARDVGSVQITATVDGRSGNTSVTVNAIPVAQVVVPAIPEITVRGTHQLNAVLLGARGDTLTGRTMTWQSSDTTVARIDAAGSIIAVGAGTATITASSEGKQGAAVLTVKPRELAIKGLYTQFERRGFPNGYYSGEAIKDFQIQDRFVPSLGLVKDELASQLDAIRSLGVNTITFELRSADPVWEERAYPSCNVSPATGLLFPRPPAADLNNLVAFLDLAQNKGLKVMLRLVNNRMDEQYREGSAEWLGSILNRIKSHPALELVLFEGDERTVDANGDGVKDSCGGLAEPPLYLGPDRPGARYVEWAIGYAMSLGLPARKLSAQAVLGTYVVEMELGAGANAQDRHLWHPLGVMKTIFERLNIPEDQRTYAISFYQSNKCYIAAGYSCTDLPPAAWAEETLLRAWSKIGYRSQSRIVAVEYGAVTPYAAGWNADRALEAGVALMRKYGLEGGGFWRWTNFTDAEDADPETPYSIKWRGMEYRYTPAADVMRRVYNQP